MKASIKTPSLISLMTLFISVLLAPAEAYGFIDDVGICLFYGRETPLNNKHWGSEEYSFNVTGMILSAGSYLDEEKRWKIDSGLKLRFYEAKGAGTERHGRSLGIDLYLKRRLSFEPFDPLIFFIGAGGGFSWFLDSNDQPDFGDSGMLGTFGVSLDAEFPVKEGFSLGFGIKLTHTSDPLNNGEEDGDFGRNHLKGVLYARIDANKLVDWFHSVFN